jgi:dTDP-4-amino-4,6-dideoxygalactose transaminase/predicted dehydrogenase
MSEAVSYPTVFAKDAKLKTAVVGLGYFGVHYVRLANEAVDANLVAVCDVEQARVDASISKYPHVKGYTDLDALLKHDGLEAVILITPATMHYKLAKKVLQAKKHLLIEKPFTTNSKEAYELTEIAKHAGVTCLVGHTFIYNTGIQKTKDIKESGDFGSLLYMYSTRTNLGPFRDDVNAAWDLAPHDISIFQYLTGKVPSWVCAIGGKPLSTLSTDGEPAAKRAKNDAQEDVAFITMGYADSEVVANVHVSWANPKKVRELTLVGSGMRVVFDDMDPSARVKVYKTPTSAGDIHKTDGSSSAGHFHAALAVGDTYFPSIKHSEPLKDQVTDFFRCAKEGKQPISDARFGADVVHVLEAIQDSLKRGGVKVPVVTHASLNPAKLNIPLVDLKANYRRIKGEVIEAMTDVMENTAFVLGPHLKRFEDNYAKFCGTKCAIGVNSGTDSIFLALKFLGVGPGDEVITQANTFVATVASISNTGATPILVDHDEYYMMDVNQIEAAITPKTKCIMPVHLYGQCADMDKILEIAKKHKLLVAEDASQAHGAMYKGRRAGSLGDAGCFSFYPGKNMGAYGDGGCIVTNNEDLATRIQWWRSWGCKVKYHHEIKGGNSRLDCIQAVVLDIKLKYIDDWNGRRREIADLYCQKLQGVGDFVLPKVRSENVSVWHLYVVQTEHRDAVLKFLNDLGIGAGIHYPIPIHELNAYKGEMDGWAGKLPRTSDNAKKILSLPMFPELTNEQVDIVVAKCKEFFAKHSNLNGHTTGLTNGKK